MSHTTSALLSVLDESGLSYFGISDLTQVLLAGNGIQQTVTGVRTLCGPRSAETQHVSA